MQKQSLLDLYSQRTNMEHVFLQEILAHALISKDDVLREMVQQYRIEIAAVLDKFMYTDELPSIPPADHTDLTQDSEQLKRA